MQGLASSPHTSEVPGYCFHFPGKSAFLSLHAAKCNEWIAHFPRVLVWVVPRCWLGNSLRTSACNFEPCLRMESCPQQKWRLNPLFQPNRSLTYTAALRGVQHNNQWCHVRLENESVESDLFNESKKWVCLTSTYYDTTSLNSVTFNQEPSLSAMSNMHA